MAYGMRGVSLVTLSIAIIILVVITSVLVYSAQDSVKIRKLEALKNDISSLTDKVSSYYLEHEDIPVSTKYENSNFVENLKASNQQNPNDEGDYYVLELSALDGVTLNYGADYDSVSGSSDVASLDDLYVINRASHTIYYVRSVEVNDVNYYTIQEDWTKIELQVIPIYTAEQLSKVGSGEAITVEEAGGIEYTFSLDGTYVLKNDIDLSSICYKVDGTTTNDKSWTPIGTSDTPFTGKLYGNGHTISNLYINSKDSYQGLFGYAKEATIDGITAKGEITTTQNYTAGVVGESIGGKILNCNNYVGVVANVCAGGVVGLQKNSCKIENCFNFADIEGMAENSIGGTVAGITGFVQGDSQIINCANFGDIIAKTGANCIGGITGASNAAKVDSCYNAGTINANGSGTGGIVGYQYNEGVIASCYNIGTVNGNSGARVGGLIGHNSSGKVTNSYNIKNITGASRVGGVVGTNDTKGEIAYCYSLSTLSLKVYGINSGAITDSTTKTESEMKSDAFVELLNTDNDEEVWVKDTKNINKGYPILKWQTE